MSPPLQNFTNGNTPAVGAPWLNAVDVVVTEVFQQAATNPLARAALCSDLPLEIANGGTAARTAAAALANLGGVTAVAVAAQIVAQIQIGQTPAEEAAGVVPTVFITGLGEILFESDARRYGADTGAADNSAAFTDALSVSGAGGREGYFPAGTWNFTAPIVAAAGSSWRGTGKSTRLVFAHGIDGIQYTASDDGILPQPRFARDAIIKGTLSGTANAVHGIYANATVLAQIQFDNVGIENFEWAVYGQGLYYSQFFNCWSVNCYHGLYFNNQSVNVWVTNCTWQYISTGTLIIGSGLSSGIEVEGSPEAEGVHVQGGSIYGFHYDIKLGLIFETQIEHVDISAAIVCPVYLTSALAPCVIRDCFIELGPNATGSWNTTNPGNLTGVFVTAVSPGASSKLVLDSNEIVSDVTVTGSTAIYLGDGNDGLVYTGNELRGFDIGIGGGNTTLNPGGSFNGGRVVGNTISAATSSMLFNSLCQDLTLGPNIILSGALPAFTSLPPETLNYTQLNVPMRGTVSFVASTTVAVAFDNPMPWINYQVLLGGTAAGFCWITSKTINGFTINCSASSSGSIDWMIK